MAGELSTTQIARLASIDFHLYYYGEVTRRDHAKRFGISIPSASNDLSLYFDFIHIGAVIYDGGARAYRATSKFQPFYKHPDKELVQCMLVHGNDQLLQVLAARFGTAQYKVAR